MTSSRSISGGAGRVRRGLALGQQQGEQGEALLALRAEGAQLAAGTTQDELVAVRPVCREAAREVGLPPLAQLGRQCRGVGRRRARAVGERGVAVEAELLRTAGEGIGELLHQPPRGRP